MASVRRVSALRASSDLRIVVLANDQTVNHDFNVVDAVAIQRDVFLSS